MKHYTQGPSKEKQHKPIVQMGLFMDMNGFPILYKLSSGKTAEEKVLVTWSEKYAKREKVRRNGAAKYASKLTNAELLRITSK